MPDIDKITDKIAKLLRQAEDVAGTPEEAVFQAKAFELLAKYGIDQAMVDAARQGIDAHEIANAVKREFIIRGKYASAQMLLLHNIATALHCKTVQSALGGGVIRFYVFGMERHTDRVSVLWDLLRPQMMRQVEVVRPVYGDGVKKFRRAWIAGFGHTIGQRLRAEENKALENDTSGALVLFRGDKQRAEAALQAEFPRLRTKRSGGYDRQGWAAGQAAGQRASMSLSLAG